ncbi:putative serine protease transmembrane protein [Desulforapulum autotrophicum HRM2]|uniref:Serine protease transmembrane protein n=1 Tax=Desulforapulum autotrophicum (strain ATCC 43914 / DSM 3382 / VKM B-1955 / HRM2) TaxID=177437 RepID=C0QKD2_DESAH|nr:SPFH domain-containing protein [Desulforapulum autotrophicum]ACN14003.1 putative serine protease transmembrane protein [Desulforapulum autotrophicum HRM2]
MTEKASQVFLQRAQVRNLIRRIAITLFAITIVYTLAALVYSTHVIYKVKLNYAMVIEQFGGIREAVTDVGWHARLPFFTRLEQEVPLMNQRLFLGATHEPMRIISRENVALWTSAVLTYRIHDLRVWAIENLAPKDLLQGDFDGIVKDILQAQKVNSLISDREGIKEKIFKALKSRPINEGGPTLEEKYGMTVVSFVLRETRFGDDLIAATEEKKRRELLAEAENYAADQEADRIRKLYTAYLESISSLQKALGTDGKGIEPDLLNFLTQQKWASAYANQTGQKTFVLHGSRVDPSMTLPAMPDAPDLKGKHVDDILTGNSASDGR